MSTVTATELLFGKRRTLLSGTGVRALIVDAACATAISEIADVPDPGDDDIDERLAHVAERRLRLLCDVRSPKAPGGDLGLVGDASLTRLGDASVQRGDLGSVERAVRSHGPFDVILFARPLPGDLGPEAIAALDALSRKAVVVARSSAPGVLPPLAVEMRPGHDVFVCTRAPDGSLGHLPLEEARTALTGALAVLWVQRLRLSSLPTDADAVRAVLLASSAASPERGESMGTDLLDAALPQVLVTRASFGSTELELAGPGRTALVARGPEASPFWFAQPVRLTVEGASSSATSGDGFWAARRSEDGRGKLVIHVEPRGDSSASKVFTAAFGARVQASDTRTSSVRRPLTIVGIGASHDASACVMRDGRLVAAIQLERLTRKKHDGNGFLSSQLAVDYCLATAGLSLSDVDLFAFNCQPLGPEHTGLGLPTHDASFDLFDPFGERAVFVSHHLCHAFGAFFGSPFERASVIVMDGSGGTTAGRPDVLIRGRELADYLALRQSTAERLAQNLHVFSAYTFGPEGFSLVEREHGRSFNVLSGAGHLGELYASVSQYVFGSWQDSGKLMGLAPYGDPERFGPSLLEKDDRGYLQFRRDWRNQHRRALYRADPLEYKDLAARVQRDLEEALLQRFRLVLAKTRCPRVAYAGGVALNSVANQRLRAETGAEALYVMPASSDAGTSIGAAAAAHHLETGKLTSTDLRSDAFGHTYGARDVEHAIRQVASLVRTRKVDLGDVAERIQKRQIIGWFSGASELGPRALGQRSLLASPADRAMWTYINRRIKYREDFRPFAPMVPEEVASEFFEIDEPSPFMLRVVRVRERFRSRLGAITHVDGSARVQTVRKDQLPEIHELLHRVGALSGVPVLVNTSFNVRGEPLIDSPKDALEMLLATHLDAVVFGGSLLVEPLPPPTSGLSDETFLALPPKSHVKAVVGANGRTYVLVPEARDQELTLPEWAFDLLSRIAADASVGDLLAPLGAARRDDARALLSSFVALRLLLICRRSPAASGSPAIAATSVSTGHAPNASSPPVRPHALPGADDQFVPGTQRVRALAATIDAAREKLVVMGVTRVADVTHYDYLGIPVVSCIRPFVHDRDITCTQGKGLTLDDALASALMETVERFSAWHNDHVQRRIASPQELTREGRPFLALEQLGGSVSRDAPVEWVWAEAVRGEPRWVPAAAVFAPYVPQKSVTVPLGWSSSGLSSGNTLGEAIVHGLLEVVERDALSRFLDGTEARLLDETTIPPGPERDLLDRLSSAGIERFIVDTSGVADIPMFSVSLFDRHGPEPRIPVSGQGCNPSPTSALRRAILEAAQSRVVAIQGSREDLERHGTNWVDDDAERIRHWNASREAAARGGASRFAAEIPGASTVGELFEAIASKLASGHHRDILYCDLTHPRVGIPVARVIVPDMYDGEADPATRRRGAR